MNLQEFAALKVADTIENLMNPGSGVGIVTECLDSGVRVKWGASDKVFYYTVNSTAWMHWSKYDPDAEKDVRK